MLEVGDPDHGIHDPAAGRIFALNFSAFSGQIPIGRTGREQLFFHHFIRMHIRAGDKITGACN